jgi:hypothetical protein
MRSALAALFVAGAFLTGCVEYDPLPDRRPIVLTCVFLVRKSSEPGCHDTLMPVWPSHVPHENPLRGAVDDLLQITDAHNQIMRLDNVFGESGLLIEDCSVHDGTAVVAFRGSLGLLDECDAANAAGQIEATARKLPGVQRAVVTLNGEPLRDAMAWAGGVR